MTAEAAVDQSPAFVVESKTEPTETKSWGPVPNSHPYVSFTVHGKEVRAMIDSGCAFVGAAAEDWVLGMSASLPAGALEFVRYDEPLPLKGIDKKDDHTGACIVGHIRVSLAVPGCKRPGTESNQPLTLPTGSLKVLRGADFGSSPIILGTHFLWAWQADLLFSTGRMVVNHPESSWQASIPLEFNERAGPSGAMLEQIAKVESDAERRVNLDPGPWTPNEARHEWERPLHEEHKLAASTNENKAAQLRAGEFSAISASGCTLRQLLTLALATSRRETCRGPSAARSPGRSCSRSRRSAAS